jgi:hypothetical protein
LKEQVLPGACSFAFSGARKGVVLRRDCAWKERGADDEVISFLVIHEKPCKVGKTTPSAVL